MHINETAQKRAWKIWELSQKEEKYQEILAEIRKLENQYEAALDLLPGEQEQTIRNFVSQCEAMSWRMLQIACAVLQLPDDGKG